MAKRIRKRRARPLSYDPKHALNAICPYFTMFPLEYPLRVLSRHRRAAPVVMDPFCGRGTTLYAARVLGLAARGIDSSPIAIAIAQAKLCTVQRSEALDLARNLIEQDETGPIPTNEYFRTGFHHTTLRQLCAVRWGLLKRHQKTHAAVLLRAAMLGCLHGPRAQSEANQSYFSNQMPRTFASKPDYSVKYWKRHRLRSRQVDVVAVLKRKLDRIETAAASTGGPRRARLGDARLSESLPYSARDFSVVVTSPPYFGMRTYVEDQWLRNWFLGGPDHVEYGETEQVSHAGAQTFAESLGEVWRNMARTRAATLDLYIRFGVIPSSRVDARQLMEESLEASGLEWKCVYTRAARTASHGKRQATQMAAESAATIEYDFHVIPA